MRLFFRTSSRVLGMAALGVLPIIRPAPLHAQSSRDTSFAVSSAASVEVVGWSGEIIVRGISGRTARLRSLGDGRLEVSGNSRSMRVDGERSRNRSETRIELDIPTGTRVIVRSQSGDVRVEGTNADVEVRSTSGDITVRQAARVRIDNVAGDIVASDITDGLRIGSTSGDMRIANVVGDIEVGGTSAEVSVQDARSRRVQIKVVSGDVVFSGVLEDGGRYDFSSHSGDVRLSVPRDTRAALDIQTFNGEITTRDLPLVLMPEPGAAAREDAKVRDRKQLQSTRDSLRAAMRDSMRDLETRSNELRTRRDSLSFERNLERSVERLVESLMRTIGDQLESVSMQFESKGSGRSRRFQLGDSGGPLVTISTFSGDIVLGTDATSRRR
jgi:hypothetical protein